MVENFIIKHKDFLEIFFSFLTLLATVYTAFAAKKIGEKANEISKNSLRPYLNIDFRKTKEETYIKITNNGLGTAIIRNIKITYKDETFDSIADLLHKHFSYKLFEEVQNSLNVSLRIANIDLKRESIAPQNSITLLETNHDIHNCPNITAKRLSNIKKYIANLQNILSETLITIEYVDIFEGKDSFYAKLK